MKVTLQFQPSAPPPLSALPSITSPSAHRPSAESPSVAQPSLPAPSAAPSRRRALAANTAWLEQFLFASRRWLSTREILHAAPRLTDRHLRYLAGTSPQILCGPKGYRHLAHATPADIRHTTHHYPQPPTPIKN